MGIATPHTSRTTIPFPDVSGLRLSEAAHAYARAGIAVFPCMPGGKRPLTVHGFKNATTTVRQIDAWWAAHPEANIGIATGDRFDVLDIDVHTTGSGYPTLTALQRTGLTHRWAAAVRTPSGGLHLYYPTLPDRPQPSWTRAAAHVDFRGVGGYVIAPPSQVAGSDEAMRGYEIIARGRAPWPVNGQRIRDFLTPSALPRTNAIRTIGRADTSPGVLGEWVSGLVAGNRNAGLFWAACRLAELGLDECDTLNALTGPAGATGLDAREIVSTIRSAQRTIQVAPEPAGSDHLAAAPALAQARFRR